MMEACSSFTVAVLTHNEQAKTVAKALVDKWFYTYGIPSRIHNDQGRSFDNKIIHHLCTCMGSHNQEHHHMACLKHCLSHTKPNWPAHLSSLVFAYNAMPNSTTGLQLYQLMFGCRALTPCDNWQGLNNYDSSESVSEMYWIQEHHELMLAANQHAFKSIQKSAEQSTLWVIWSCCGIIPKIVIKSKTILKTKSLLW